MIQAAIRIDCCLTAATTTPLDRALEIADRAAIPVTLCVTTGPDRSGLALFNTLREPGFLRRMLRLNPLRVYGWRTLLAGTLLPARPVLTAELASRLRRAAAHGHEIALHAHAHRLWQNRIEQWSTARVEQDLHAARAAFHRFGITPRGSAAPAWRTTPTALRALPSAPSTSGGVTTAWAGDLRAHAPVQPTDAHGTPLGPPQLPVNLPTLDELVSWPERPSAAERLRLLQHFSTALAAAPQPPPLIYTAHPEVDALGERPTFVALIDHLRSLGATFTTLSSLAASLPAELPRAPLRRARCRGRGGWVATAGDPLPPWLTPLDPFH